MGEDVVLLRDTPLSVCVLEERGLGLFPGLVLQHLLSRRLRYQRTVVWCEKRTRGLRCPRVLVRALTGTARRSRFSCRFFYQDIHNEEVAMLIFLLPREMHF